MFVDMVGTPLVSAFTRMLTSSDSRTASSVLFFSIVILLQESVTFLVICMISPSISFESSSTPLSNFARKNPIFMGSEPSAVMIFKSFHSLMDLLMVIKDGLAE